MYLVAQKWKVYYMKDEVITSYFTCQTANDAINYMHLQIIE